MTDAYQLRVGKYHFSSQAPLPPEEVLMKMVSDLVSRPAGGKPDPLAPIYDDETEQGYQRQEQYELLRQEVSLIHPYVICIHDGPPPGVEPDDRGEAFPDMEEEMCCYFLTTPEFDAAIEPKALELAKSFGLI
jgi:hypothetical protein